MEKTEIPVSSVSASVRFHGFYAHPDFPPQVKLLLACSILYNWFLWRCIDEFFPDEDDVTSNDIYYGHGVTLGDRQAW
jgi:hypothetical protein